MLNLVERLVALILFVALLPFFAISIIIIWINDVGNPFYLQKRLGKDKKTFTIYKFRTMRVGAEKLQKSLAHLNEADGPVFKIKNDPRFTPVGKVFANSGLDEVPQLINIIKGDMSFVGPRPLPVAEAKAIPKKYDERYKVLPGIISSWWNKGNHKLTFVEWMKLDIYDVKHMSIFYKFKLILQTMKIFISVIIESIKRDPVTFTVFFIIALGLSIRIYYLATYAMWADEAFYTIGVKDNTIWQLLTGKHSFADNPGLFFVFMRLWQQISMNLVWLRIPGILLYLISVLILLKIFDKADGVAKIVVLSSYSLLPFFTHINYWVSPYNFAIALELSLVLLILKYLDGHISNRRFGTLFILLNIILINIHYSSLYFLIGYLPVGIYIFITDKQKLRTYSMTIVATILLSIPNILQVLNNSSRVNELLTNGLLLDLSSFSKVINYVFGKSYLLTENETIIQISFWALIVGGLIFSIKNKRTIIYIVGLSSIFITLTFIFVMYPHMNALAVERNYYSLFLGGLLITGAILYTRKNNYLYFPALLIIFIVLLIQILGFWNKPPTAGDVRGQKILQQEIELLTNDLYQIGNGKNIVFVDGALSEYHLIYLYKDYYLSYVYPDFKPSSVVEIQPKELTIDYLNKLKPNETVIINFDSKKLSLEFPKEISVIDIHKYIDNE